MRAGNLEQVIRIGGGRGPRVHHGVVAGTLALDTLRANREPDERIEPVQGQGQVRNKLPGAVVPLDVAEFVQQHHALAGRGPRARRRHQHDRPPAAPGHRHRCPRAAEHLNRAGQSELSGELGRQTAPLAVTRGRRGSAQSASREQTEANPRQESGRASKPETKSREGPPLDRRQSPRHTRHTGGARSPSRVNVRNGRRGHGGWWGWGCVEHGDVREESRGARAGAPVPHGYAWRPQARFGRGRERGRERRHGKVDGRQVRAADRRQQHTNERQRPH